ncbi:MAG: methyltransferase domain-containing protein [Pyrinomonadaceae bacterium]
MNNAERHQESLKRNLRGWEKKPLLRLIYRSFHELIAANVRGPATGLVVELGSGIGNIKEALPGCLRTDLFPHPWLDRVENAYSLSFPDASVSGLILFDVFHHLRHPGTAFKEFSRVLAPGGRVIIFEPSLSVLGYLIFGLLHPESLGLRERIQWFAPPGWSAGDLDYYAAQANASRVFVRKEFETAMGDWKLLKVRRLSAISYVASGGYSRPQLYPTFALPLMRLIDKGCDLFPSLFATRLLVVLEKK